MILDFNKYHGAGNDFIIIDNRQHILKADDISLIKKLCCRHYGIGADGLILIYDHDKHDFEMKYFNADGKEGSMCGNGGRCAVAFAKKANILTGSGSFVATDGIHKAIINESDISISMNDVDPPANVKGNHFLNTGSPHYIIPVPDNSKVDVNSKGRSIRWSDQFAPNGVNVNFVEYQPDGIFVRTFERGVEAETLSCGTGVTAAAISSKWNNPDGKYSVKVKTNGGTLGVDFLLSRNGITNICLHGPAKFVYEGKIKL